MSVEIARLKRQLSACGGLSPEQFENENLA